MGLFPIISVDKTTLPRHSFATIDINRSSDNNSGTYTLGTAFQITAAQKSGALLFEASEATSITINNNYGGLFGFALKNGIWSPINATSKTLEFGAGNDLIFVGLASSATGYTTYNIIIN